MKWIQHGLEPPDLWWDWLSKGELVVGLFAMAVLATYPLLMPRLRPGHTLQGMRLWFASGFGLLLGLWALTWGTRSHIPGVGVFLAIGFLVAIFPMGGHPDRPIQGKSNEAQPGLQATDFPALVNSLTEDLSMLLLDSQGRIIGWNRGSERLLGFQPETALGKSFTIFCPPSEVGEAARALDLSRTRGWSGREAPRLNLLGGCFQAYTLLVSLQEPNRGLLGHVAVICDLSHREFKTERQRTYTEAMESMVQRRTAELKENHARLLGFVEHANAAILFKDVQGRILMGNRHAESMYGHPLKEMLGKLPTELLGPELGSIILDQDLRVIRQREELLTDTTWTRPDGTKRQYLMQRFPLLDEQRNSIGMGVIGTDITDRLALERAADQQRRLHAIGLLAAGIAHNFNNILGGILGNLEMLRTGWDAPPGVRERLQAMDEAVDRATRLVHQFMAFAGKGKALIQPMDLNDQVEGTLRVLRPALPAGISLRWDSCPSRPVMLGDMTHIQQMLLSLVLNAMEAMGPQGGQIVVRLALRQLSAADLEQPFHSIGLNPGLFAILEVEDDGPGIPAQAREHLFDPFFSTKFVGRGMGLAAVMGIVRSHQGAITYRSEEGKGTTFTIALPAADPSILAPARTRTSGQEKTPFHGQGTILIADDEPHLRGVMAAALHRIGFQILEARDGAEALELYRRHGDGIRLIILDLTMPIMDGDEAYRELRRMNAMVPIILSSGYGREEALARFRGRGLAGFLPKPFRFEELVEVIAGALGEHPLPPHGVGYDLKAAVEWRAEWDTGHPQTDEEHRELLRLYNRLAETVSTRREHMTEIVAHLADLQQAAWRHFKQEEAAPAHLSPEHREVHRHLNQQILDLMTDLQHGRHPPARDFLNFVEDWLFCHTLHEDREFTRREG